MTPQEELLAAVLNVVRAAREYEFSGEPYNLVPSVRALVDVWEKHPGRPTFEREH